ncbi:17434_t:CDS:2, partial [Gigaspora margarita]
MSIENVWNEYKQQRDGEFFTENVSVAFVPTAARARGIEETKKFLFAAYDLDTWCERKRSISNQSETTIKFVSGEGAWIVPGVDERYAVDKHVVIPTVTVATFEDDKISSITNRYCERYFKCVLNTFSRIEPTAARMNPNQITSGRQNVHTSSRINQPGGIGGNSSFSTLTQMTKQSQFPIGDNQAQPSHDPIQHSQKKLNPQGKNVSQVVIGDGGEVEGIRMSCATAAARNNFKPSSTITRTFYRILETIYNDQNNNSEEIHNITHDLLKSKKCAQDGDSVRLLVPSITAPQKGITMNHMDTRSAKKEKKASEKSEESDMNIKILEEILIKVFKSRSDFLLLSAFEAILQIVTELLLQNNQILEMCLVINSGKKNGNSRYGFVDLIYEDLTFGDLNPSIIMELIFQ